MEKLNINEKIQLIRSGELSARDVVNLCSTNQAWRRACQKHKDLIWKELLERDFPYARRVGIDLLEEYKLNDATISPYWYFRDDDSTILEVGYGMRADPDAIRAGLRGLRPVDDVRLWVLESPGESEVWTLTELYPTQDDALRALMLMRRGGAIAEAFTEVMADEPRPEDLDFREFYDASLETLGETGAVFDSDGYIILRLSEITLPGSGH